jgi:hypothetical protein
MHGVEDDLFVNCFTTVGTSDYIAWNDRINNEVGGYKRKRSWPVLSTSPGLRNATKKVNKKSRPPDRDVNVRSPEYEAGVLTNRLPRH